VYVIHSGPVEMMSNEITGNAADWFGGGVAIARYVSGETLLANNVMLNNQTDGYGSGLYVEGPAKLFHTTAASNTGGDGSGLSIAGDVALTNTILVSHSIGIHATEGSTLTVNGVLWNNTPVTVSRATTTTVAFQNQHTGDPAFAADGYHLMIDSAAIDSGIETDVASDIDGDSRPQGAAFDLGADEYVTETVFTLGVLGPFSGPSSSTGDEFRDVVNMAFDAIDWRIEGHRIEPVWIDSWYVSMTFTEAGLAHASTR
jgi:hypothetical protein